MKLSTKQSDLIKSYWHAFIAVETAFVIQYGKNYIASPHAKFNLASFAYSALGAVAAPATRVLVAKYPFFSPLALRITTKIAKGESTLTPTKPVA